jgi:hypothetical protein
VDPSVAEVSAPAREHEEPASHASQTAASSTHHSPDPSAGTRGRGPSDPGPRHPPGRCYPPEGTALPCASVTTDAPDPVAQLGTLHHLRGCGPPASSWAPTVAPSEASPPSPHFRSAIFEDLGLGSKDMPGHQSIVAAWPRAEEAWAVGATMTPLASGPKCPPCGRTRDSSH